MSNWGTGSSLKQRFRTGAAIKKDVQRQDRKGAPMQTKGAPFTTEQHMEQFCQFITLECSVGGPDPHLATLGRMIEAENWAERVWRCGLYASGYNVPTAEIIWQHWPFERMRSEGSMLTGWIEENWQGIGLRRERRAVRTPEKFARCLASIYQWAHIVTREVPEWWVQDTPQAFEKAWESTGTIYGLGRYVQLKLVEALHRYADAEFRQTDIRARGGTSPREGLSLLYPAHEFEFLLPARDDRHKVQQTEELAKRLHEKVAATVPAYVAGRFDYFKLQVVLCEYKKVWQGKQYPGRTHDTELRYLADARAHWGHETDMLRARADVFLPVSLGEANGWHRQREDLERTLPDHGYQWSDLFYDYGATEDPRTPVHRERPIPPLDPEAVYA